MNCFIIYKKGIEAAGDEAVIVNEIDPDPLSKVK